MLRFIVRKLIVYTVMVAFILGCVLIVGGVGRMLNEANGSLIVGTGLGLAYVLDKQLIAWFKPKQA